MTDEEVEVVAEELAKIGGTSWYPGRERGPLTKVVTDRYRDGARVAIAALDQFKARETACAQEIAKGVMHGINENPQPPRCDDVRPGATVIYRAPGDQRAYPCRVVEIQGDRAYLAPIVRTRVGWISFENLLPAMTKQVWGMTKRIREQ